MIDRISPRVATTPQKQEYNVHQLSFSTLFKHPQTHTGKNPNSHESEKYIILRRQDMLILNYRE